MIDKEVFRKTEKKLYNYYGKDKKIGNLKKKIDLLYKQINDIDDKLRNTDISIPEESRAMSYEERVQTSSDGTSYAERTLIRITERLIIEQSRKKEEIARMEEELRNIEADNIIIKENIGELREEDKEFLRVKYKECNKDWQVGVKLGMDQSTVTRKRQRLVEDVSRWELWFRC